MATFAYTGEFGDAVLPLRSQLYLFCDVAGQWMVAYRFSHRQSFDAAARIAGFMRALPWTIAASSGDPPARCRRRR